MVVLDTDHLSLLERRQSEDRGNCPCPECDPADQKPRRLPQGPGPESRGLDAPERELIDLPCVGSHALFYHTSVQYSASWSCASCYGHWTSDPPGRCDRGRRGAKSQNSYFFPPNARSVPCQLVLCKPFRALAF